MPQFAPRAQADSYSRQEVWTLLSGRCQALEHWMMQPGLHAWL